MTTTETEAMTTNSSGERSPYTLAQQVLSTYISHQGPAWEIAGGARAQFGGDRFTVTGGENPFQPFSVTLPPEYQEAFGKTVVEFLRYLPPTRHSVIELPQDTNDSSSTSKRQLVTITGEPLLYRDEATGEFKPLSAHRALEVIIVRNGENVLAPSIKMIPMFQPLS